MIDLLPPETRQQVNRNRLYLDNVEKVQESQKNFFYEFVLKTGQLPKITPSGFILHEVPDNSPKINLN